MTEPETIEAEVEEVMTQALEPYRQALPSTLLEGSSPRAQLAHAHEVATALADVIDKQKLFKQIGQKKYVLVEGWTLLGSLLGVVPVTEWTRQIGDGWEARVEARTLAGQTVGAAEAMCSHSEQRWKTADEYAVRSMAQTRATSKALRQPLGFIVTLAGYEATPEEEMPREAIEPQRVITGPAPLKKPSSWPKLTEMISAYDEATHDDFMAFVRSAMVLQYGVEESKDLTAGQKRELLLTAGAAAVILRTQYDAASFPPPSREEIRGVWAQTLGGQELAHPDEIPAEEPLDD